jgi:spermidine synthase
VTARRLPSVTKSGAAVFISGVASMGLEIVAGRLLAPEFGSSIFVWGSIIGVFLAALSVGYWLGGERAGRASESAMAAMFVGATISVAVLIVVGEPFLAFAGDLPIPQRFAPLLPVTVLFGPPTLLLGFISPYAAELASAERKGTASGRVYALGTIGSIVGAFGTTFLLIPWIGVTGIEVIFGVMLLAAAALVTPRSDTFGRGGTVVAALVLVLAASTAVFGVSVGESTVYQTQTAYQELRVADDGGVRTLYLDGVRHSAMDLNDRDRYVFEYTRYFHMPLLLMEDPEIDRVLFIGGGGFSGPKRYVSEYNVTVDVVEIDPEVVRTAQTYFGVSESENLRIHTIDGRQYLEETNHTYDLIVMDAYRADRVPHHLATVEFMRLARSKLDDDGVFMANVISARAGRGSAFYRAEYRTMDQVFPQVYSFPTTDTAALQNIELVATVNPERVSQAELGRRNHQREIGIDLSEEVRNYRTDVEVGDAPILRDDYAPVDRLLQSQAGRRYVIAQNNGTATP